MKCLHFKQKTRLKQNTHIKYDIQMSGPVVDIIISSRISTSDYVMINK